MKVHLRRSSSTAIALCLLLMLCYRVAWPQKVISGNVSDEAGVGIPGVNIIVENTTTGTTTRAEGNYSEMTCPHSGDYVSIRIELMRQFLTEVDI